MSALFKKPKRNFRKKVSENNSDEETGDLLARKKERIPFIGDDDDLTTETSMGVDPKPEIKALKKEKKKKRANKDGPEKLLSSVPTLSFDHADEDDDTEVFKVKKSNQSRKLTKLLKKEKTSDSCEKQKNDKLVAKDKVNGGKGGGKDEISKEKANEKLRQLREELRTMNGDEAERLEGSDDEDGQHIFRAMLARGEIPDAKTIHLIRKQRQQARDDDFLSLDDEETDTNKKESRLVRDDEHDRSDDDEEERVDFSINNAARERQKMRDDFLAAEHGSDEESDQEREWEAQQIRKAALMPGQETIITFDHSNSNSSHPDPVINYNTSHPQTAASTSSITNTVSFKPFKSLTKGVVTATVTIESIRKGLQERMSDLDSVCRTHKLELDRLVGEVEDTEKEIEDCTEKVPDLEKQYKFFQEMRGYVRDLVECLNEKVPTINNFETRMKNMLRQRADLLLQRRQQDVRDQCQDYMTNKKHQVVMETQEEYSRQRRVAEREARRSRRRRGRESRNLAGHHDGLSSDDEENQSEISKFNIEKDDVQKGTERLFEDVVDEFSQLECAKKHFEKWKLSYGDSYQEAYIGLCLPKLLNPFIRLSLVDWNPLKEVCFDIEEMSWYNSLVLYACRSEEDINPDRRDDDIKLLPAIIDKIIIPKLTYLCEHVWDPMSTAETSRLVNLIQKLIKDYPTVSANNKNTQTLLKAIADRIKKSLDDDVFMPLYPKSVLENRSSGPAVFFHRQLWTCIKLLGNILSWQGILSSLVLQQLSLDGLLNRYIVLGLHSSCLTKESMEKCQAIISTFPKEWFANRESDSTIPKLENLCRYLLQTAQHLHKGSIMVKDSERLEIRNHIKQISKMLILIHATDHAITLSNTYSFKISQV